MKTYYKSPFSPGFNVPFNIQPNNGVRHPDFDDTSLVRISDFFERWSNGLPVDERLLSTRYPEIDDSRSVNSMLEGDEPHFGDDVLDFLDNERVQASKVNSLDKVITDKIDATTTINDDDASK